MQKLFSAWRKFKNKDKEQETNLLLLEMQEHNEISLQISQ